LGSNSVTGISFSTGNTGDPIGNVGYRNLIRRFNYNGIHRKWVYPSPYRSQVLLMSENNVSENKSPFDRLLDFFSHINTIVTGIAMVVMTVIFGWLVFGRYVLNATPTWVEQVSLLLVVYIAFLGASTGVHQKTHLGVSVFREMSPKPVRRFFDFLTHGILAGFGILMAIYGYKLTLFKWSAQIPLIRVSEGWRSLPIIISGVLIFIYSIGHLIRLFSNRPSGDS
jgi:TRAP-type C4-dicarboxylate transport system permease small subunit